MRAKLAVVVAAFPAAVVIAGLPLANRLHPVVFGLPFLLFWIVGWVMATPLFLGAAYLLRRAGDGRSPEGGRP